MAWLDAEILLRNNVLQMDHLDPVHQYKIVTEIPPYPCNNFNNEEGFRIQVGAISYINAPMSMLENIYNEAVHNDGLYNNPIFVGLYPVLFNNKPCYVHAIGKLFFAAGVMEQVNAGNYHVIV